MKIFNLILMLLLCFGLHAQNKVLRYTEGADKGYVKESDLKVNYNNVLNTPIIVTPSLEQILGAGNSTNNNDIIFGLGSGASNRSVGIYGNYDATKPQHIWSIGSAYRLNATSSNYGNFYGLAYSFERDYGAVGNNSQGIQGLGHQLGWFANGVVQTAIGTGIYTNGNISSTQNLNLGGSAIVNGNLTINTPIGQSGIDYKVAGVTRIFQRYDGVDNMNEGSLRWYSYYNDGSFYNNIMDLYRNGNLRLTGILDNTSSGGGIGLTNKIRFYNTGDVAEDVSSNNFGIGLQHSTGRISYSAGQNGFHSFYTQNVKRFSINYDGNVVADNNFFANGLSAAVFNRTYLNNTTGWANMSIGSTSHSGFLEIFRPNQQRSLYVGYAQNNGANQYIAEAGSWHYFGGGKVEIANNISAYDASLINAKISNQVTGGFGAASTGGSADWNHISNARSGNGYSLLLGTATNGFGDGNYYHSFCYEYASKDGTGNLCQYAIPYYIGDTWQRSRYDNVWTAWQRIVSSTFANITYLGINATAANSTLLAGQNDAFYRNATNINAGSLADVRLSTNVALKNGSNTFSQVNSFEGGLRVKNSALVSSSSSLFEQDVNGILKFFPNQSNTMARQESRLFSTSFVKSMYADNSNQLLTSVSTNGTATISHTTANTASAGPSIQFKNGRMGFARNPIDGFDVAQASTHIDFLNIAQATKVSGIAINNSNNYSVVQNFTPNDVVNIPDSVASMKLLRAGSWTSENVTVNIPIPNQKSRRLVLIFAGLPLNSGNIIFAPPSGFTILNNSGTNKSYSASTGSTGGGVRFEIIYFSDNTVAIQRQLND